MRLRPLTSIDGYEEDSGGKRESARDREREEKEEVIEIYHLQQKVHFVFAIHSIFIYIY